MAQPQIRYRQTEILLTHDDSSREHLLTPQALDFLAELHQIFEPDREHLLNDRRLRQTRYDAGESPRFLAETTAIREQDWQVAPIPAELADRRVEITGPVDRKMVINGLNSGARVYMADFEDSHCPAWDATLAGHQNLVDAIRGNIRYTSPQGKQYQLQPNPALLMVRPRGWHLQEKHMLVDGQRISAALFDFGLFLFSCLPLLKQRGQRPLFYLPKLEHHHEARLWARIFQFAEKTLSIPSGVLKASVLIETLPAAFQMHEIMYQLRDYIVALNCGRWDYIFSYIKTFRNHPDKLLPQRSQVQMTAPFLHNYSRLLIHSCHRRGALAMGGMAAQIPVPNDPRASDEACRRVAIDKLREVSDGHDGTWVAHPALIPVAMQVFDQHMPWPNQLETLPDISDIDPASLLQPAVGSITQAGLVNNIEVALEYLSAWLSGSGCVPIHQLMEDAATAEIARAQLWQWAQYQAVMDDGQAISKGLLKTRIQAAMLRQAQQADAGAVATIQRAAELLLDAVNARRLPDFITLSAYEHLH